jgi:hypothetical protein
MTSVQATAASASAAAMVIATRARRTLARLALGERLVVGRADMRVTIDTLRLDAQRFGTQVSVAKP